jgi:hypothetical protein
MVFDYEFLNFRNRFYCGCNGWGLVLDQFPGLIRLFLTKHVPVHSLDFYLTNRLKFIQKVLSVTIFSMFHSFLFRLQ